MKKENNQKYVVVSVYDAHPFFQEELKIIFSELDKMNITKKTIFVTPNLDNKYNINNYPEFIDLIQKERGKKKEQRLPCMAILMKRMNSVKVMRK